MGSEFQLKFQAWQLEEIDCKLKERNLFINVKFAI